jgi:hypothetical protein
MQNTYFVSDFMIMDEPLLLSTRSVVWWEIINIYNLCMLKVQTWHGTNLQDYVKKETEIAIYYNGSCQIDLLQDEKYLQWTLLCTGFMTDWKTAVTSE